MLELIDILLLLLLLLSLLGLVYLHFISILVVMQGLSSICCCLVREAILLLLTRGSLLELLSGLEVLLVLDVLFDVHLHLIKNVKLVLINV
jgi:hypothetical protein